MMASAGTLYINADALPARGVRASELMPCASLPPQSRNDALGSNPNVLKSFCVAASSPARAAPTWGGDRKKCVSAPFHLFHPVCPRSPSSLFVTESENSYGAMRGDAQKLFLFQKRTGL